jgi:vacuolar protein sorting-associated protein 13A/C
LEEAERRKVASARGKAKPSLTAFLQSMKVNNNLLGIEILHMGWESIQHIRLDVEGKQSYRLKNGKDGIEHRVVVEIKLKDHVKSVVFHGGLTLDNQSEEPMQITMVDSKRKIVSPVWTIGMK